MAYKLIHEKTGKELKPGDTVKDFRGEESVLESFALPRSADSTGRVYLKEAGVDIAGGYYPSVIGAKIVKVETE